MKLLFLLLFSPLCLAVCPSGYYKDDAVNQCLLCTPCHITLKSCTSNKDSVCGTVGNPKKHNFKKNRLVFLDDTIDDSDANYHNGNVLSNVYSRTLMHDKEHHKKNGHHGKQKHSDKHHHKKQHFEFNDDEYFDSYNDDLDFDKPRKHKKHYEFNFKKNVHNSKESLRKKHIKETTEKPTTVKHVENDEEKLEELLIESQKLLELQKDNLLKTLKEDDERLKEKNMMRGKKKVRLNSPVYDTNEGDNYEIFPKNKYFKGKDNFDEDSLRALADLEEIDEEKIVIPTHREFLGEPSSLSNKVETPEEIIRDEMGSKGIFEKPRFNVIPYVLNNKTHRNKDGVVSLPFTAPETAGWNWPVVAVASAIISGFVFLLVVAITFLCNSKKWKKVKKSYHKGIEKSSRIGLMQPILACGTPELHTTSLYMENLVSSVKDEEKKVDQIV